MFYLDKKKRNLEPVGPIKKKLLWNPDINMNREQAEESGHDQEQEKHFFEG